MKKIKFLAMMIAALTFCMGFTACGDDNDDEPASIVGTWAGAAVRYPDEEMVVTFNADGTMSGVYDGDAFTGHYKVIGDHLFWYENDEDSEWEGDNDWDYIVSYSISGNTLTFGEIHSENFILERQ